MRELIVDSFAGGGGASTGIEWALGRSPDYAINHDDAALSMHAVNHPDTVHVSKNIWKVVPDELVGRRPVGLAWFSPDCKHFSKAKGGKPVKRNIRDLAWVVVLWAKRVRPRVICLENVEEFRDWGPVGEDGQPCKVRKGQTFKAWVRELERLGYKVRHWELRACDYGAPTIRKRLFLVARRDGLPIVKPAPTHGPPADPDVIAGQEEARRTGGSTGTHKKPWRTAVEIIDWSLPCPSIFDTSEEIKQKWGLRAKRPLADATLARIAKGVMRYVVNAEKPFLISVAHGYSGGRREYPIDDPIGTQTGTANAHALIVPHVSKFMSGSVGHGVDEPLATVTANSFHKRPGGAAPLGVVSAVLTGCGGRAGQSPPRGVEEPMATLTAKPDHVLAAPTLIQTGYGERPGQAPRVPGLDKPIGTQVAGASKHAVVAAFMAQHNAGPRPGLPGHSVDEPISTLTAAGSQQQLVASHLMMMRNSAKPWTAPDEPMHTITACGAYPHLVGAHLLNMRGSDRRGAPADTPAPTVTANGNHAALVAAFLDSYYGTDQAARLDGPMPTETVRERRALVTVEIEGRTFVITDIGMRMLTPRERFRAQGFPDDYEIETGHDGRAFTQAQQGSMCGNSVCPQVAEAIVRANYQPREEMTSDGTSAAAQPGPAPSPRGGKGMAEGQHGWAM